jgi:hypothetical protein
MLRGVFGVLGAATTGVGAWMIISEQPKNDACNASHPTAAQLSQLGMSQSCTNVVWVYFGGFALLALGVLIVVVAVSMMRKMKRNKSQMRRPPPNLPGPHVMRPS